MNALLPLPSLLRASAQDAASARMRKAGRTAWSRTDYNEAVRTLNRLCAVHYGKGIRGAYRFQVAEELERAGELFLSMPTEWFVAAIDVAVEGVAA